MRPLNDRVIVEADPVVTKTASGIIIPDSATETPQVGTVIAVGAGFYSPELQRRIPLDVTVGKRVLYGKYAGTEISFDGKDYLIMKESDIYAIL